MLPYNFKVWATPADLMSHQWIGERVSVVDVDEVLRNVLLGQEQTSWGPNSTFKYPRAAAPDRCTRGCAPACRTTSSSARRCAASIRRARW